jgi:hypothetical protein
MSIKKIKGRKKIIAASVFTAFVVLFYSQWEIPTLLHGKEFDNPEMVDYVMTETGAMLGKPDFIKVIGYNEKEASILWVRGREHVIVEMNKVKSKAEGLKWKYHTWFTCTPANGAPTCFFPWYGGFSGM